MSILYAAKKWFYLSCYITLLSFMFNRNGTLSFLTSYQMILGYKCPLSTLCYLQILLKAEIVL